MLKKRKKAYWLIGQQGSGSEGMLFGKKLNYILRGAVQASTFSILSKSLPIR
jgi:hypothetical protein